MAMKVTLIKFSRKYSQVPVPPTNLTNIFQTSGIRPYKKSGASFGGLGFFSYLRRRKETIHFGDEEVNRTIQGMEWGGTSAGGEADCGGQQP